MSHFCRQSTFDWITRKGIDILQSLFPFFQGGMGMPGMYGMGPRMGGAPPSMFGAAQQTQQPVDPFGPVPGAQVSTA